jgi:hypothetical protein
MFEVKQLDALSICHLREAIEIVKRNMSVKETYR